MTKHEADKELDQFWRDLSAEMIPDTITLEEADCRMAAADDDELSEARIQNMVQRATTRRSSLKPEVESLPPAPRGRLYRFGGFRLTANVAATSVFSALLLSAGIAVMMWPERRHSTKTLRFDTASRIATDANEPLKHRNSALQNLTIGVLLTVDVLNETAAGGGKLGKVAKEILLGLRLSVSNPHDLRFEYTRAERIEPLVDGVRTGSDEHRLQMMRELEREATSALSSIFQCGARSGPGGLSLSNEVGKAFAGVRQMLGF